MKFQLTTLLGKMAIAHDSPFNRDWHIEAITFFSFDARIDRRCPSTAMGMQLTDTMSELRRNDIHIPNESILGKSISIIGTRNSRRPISSWVRSQRIQMSYPTNSIKAGEQYTT